MGGEAEAEGYASLVQGGRTAAETWRRVWGDGKTFRDQDF